MKGYRKIDNFVIFEDDYDDYKGKYKLNALHALGMIGAFSRWLHNYDLSDDTFEDVYSNASDLRDGNRLDFMDNYMLTIDKRYQISYLWALENGIVYASVYDSEDGRYIGNIEILN
jgi:hypothetical protein